MLNLANWWAAGGAAAPEDVWTLWSVLAVLIAVALVHRLGYARQALTLRAELRCWRGPWLLCWAADMRVVSELARAALKALLLVLALSRLWAMGWPPPPTLMIEASLLGAAAVDGALLVLLAWTLGEARLLAQLEARQPVKE